MTFELKRPLAEFQVWPGKRTGHPFQGEGTLIIPRSTLDVDGNELLHVLGRDSRRKGAPDFSDVRWPRHWEVGIVLAIMSVSTALAVSSLPESGRHDVNAADLAILEEIQAGLSEAENRSEHPQARERCRNWWNQDTPSWLRRRVVRGGYAEAAPVVPFGPLYFPRMLEAGVAHFLPIHGRGCKFLFFRREGREYFEVASAYRGGQLQLVGWWQGTVAASSRQAVRKLRVTRLRPGAMLPPSS